MTHKFAICLYQPDMPQNLGVIIRTAACLGFPLHIIKPLPFSMTDKRFKGADATTTKTILHEAIPITGTIASGTYNAGGRDSGLALGSEYNIKNYSHGMFQSVFDYPYLSSSANHIFDIAIRVYESCA